MGSGAGRHWPVPQRAADYPGQVLHSRYCLRHGVLRLGLREHSAVSVQTEGHMLCLPVRLYLTAAELERNPEGLLYQGKSVLQRTMLRAGQGGVRK